MAKSLSKCFGQPRDRSRAMLRSRGILRLHLVRKDQAEVSEWFNSEESSQDLNHLGTSAKEKNQARNSQTPSTKSDIYSF